MLDVLFLFITQDGHVMARLSDGQVMCVDADQDVLGPRRARQSVPKSSGLRAVRSAPALLRAA